MKRIVLHIILLFLTANAFSQIWDYPPEPIIPSTGDSIISRNKVSQITVWKHEIKNGVETGKKGIKQVKKFDFKGNLIYEASIHGDTILYDLHDHGFWNLKIANDKIYHQKVQFDSVGNVIHLTVNDFFISVNYDSLNRPKTAVYSGGKQIWFYDASNLVKYQLFQDSVKIEERTYFYTDSPNSTCYVTEYFSPLAVKYPNRDSVVAFMSLDQKPYRIVSYEMRKGHTDSLELIFPSANTTIIKANLECTQQIYQRNHQGLLISFTNGDCDGKLNYKETYEYEFFSQEDSFKEVDDDEILEITMTEIDSTFELCKHVIKSNSLKNQNAAKNGVNLISYSISPCDFQAAEVEHMNRVIAVTQTNDSVMIQLKVYRNCCAGSQAEIELIDSSYWNINIENQKDSCALCMCNCWFDATLVFVVSNNQIPVSIALNGNYIPVSAEPIPRFTMERVYYPDGELMYIYILDKKETIYRISYDKQGKQTGIKKL